MRVDQINNVTGSNSTPVKTVGDTIKNGHVAYLIDRSGSMLGSKYVAAIKGLNQEIQELKKTEGVNYFVSILEFDSGGPWHDSKMRIIKHYENVPLSNVNYIVGAGADGGTPLYQALGELLERISTYKPKNENAVVNVFTDGQENTSEGKFAKSSTLKALISKLETEENFTVTYQGTERDRDVVVRNIGIKLSNTSVHDNTFESVAASTVLRSAAMKGYTDSLAADEDVSENFYTKVMSK